MRHAEESDYRLVAGKRRKQNRQGADSTEMARRRHYACHSACNTHRSVRPSEHATHDTDTWDIKLERPNVWAVSYMQWLLSSMDAACQATLACKLHGVYAREIDNKKAHAQNRAYLPMPVVHQTAKQANRRAAFSLANPCRLDRLRSQSARFCSRRGLAQRR